MPRNVYNVVLPVIAKLYLVLYNWVKERLETQPINDDVLSKFVPAHVNVFYCFGGIILTSFLLQTASGFSLTMYYKPTVVGAYFSVQSFLLKANLGWIIRSIHRWSAGLMLLSLILHVSRVYLTNGFKKPRELIWVSGVLLSVTTISFGVTGYSLP